MEIWVNGDTKNFVGIGKVMIDTPSLSWNIPHLHFLINKAQDVFEATCLEFGLVSCGSSQEESAERLVDLSLFHINAVIYDGGGFDELKKLSLNGFMNEFWGAYRYIEMSLAEKKQDLSHDIEGRITRAIQEMFDKKVKEIIRAMAKEAAEEAVREYERISAFKVSAVVYTPLKEAEAA
jgi:hypothetical protein